jgi:predicted amidohydrolase
VDPAPLEQLPVYETRAGRLGVLVCADSWYPAPYQYLKEQGVELLAVPSFVSSAAAFGNSHGAVMMARKLLRMLSCQIKDS